MVHETKESSLHRSPTDSLLAQLAEHETDASDFFIVKNPNVKVFQDASAVGNTICNFKPFPCPSEIVLNYLFFAEHMW